MSKNLLLGNFQSTIVGDEDFDFLDRWLWEGNVTNSGTYAYRSVNRKTIYLHKLVALRAGLSIENLIDHKDRNTLNNLRENLREAKPCQNLANKNIQINNTSGLIGVCWDSNRGKWKASGYIGSKIVNLGRFEDKIQAGKIRDKFVLQQYGEFAVLNFPGDRDV